MRDENKRPPPQQSLLSTVTFPPSPQPAMEMELQKIAQLLEASLDPRQNKQGKHTPVSKSSEANQRFA